MSVVQTERKDGYAIITIDRPKALNALNADVLNELYDSVESLGSSGDCRLIILQGAGDRAFVAGADIASMVDYGQEEALKFAELGHRTMNAIASSEMISIAAVNGYALGGGTELALACDMRILSRTAKMGLPEVTLGLIPGFGGTQRLPRIVGRGIAIELIVSGDMIDAERALAIGLTNRVVEAEDLLKETEAFAQNILSHRSGRAQKAARWAISSGMDLPMPAALQKEVQEFAELFRSEDPKKGMSAFLAKEKPQF